MDRMHLAQDYLLGPFSEGCFAGVLLARGRDPVRLLERQQIGWERAFQLVDQAALSDRRAILYSIKAGSIQVLIAHSCYCSTLYFYTDWRAYDVDVDHCYDCPDDALAAARLAYRRLKRKSRSVCGYGTINVSLLEAVKRSTEDLLSPLQAGPSEVAGTVDRNTHARSASPALKHEGDFADALQRLRTLDNGRHMLDRRLDAMERVAGELADRLKEGLGTNTVAAHRAPVTLRLVPPSADRKTPPPGGID